LIYRGYINCVDSGIDVGTVDGWKEHLFDDRRNCIRQVAKLEPQGAASFWWSRSPKDPQHFGRVGAVTPCGSGFITVLTFTTT
jgi:hypothetical protein